jgi:hypothetical protein
MKILRFFDYCFYRCASSKFAQKLDKQEYTHIAPAVWITLCQQFNILTIIIIFHIITNTTHVIDDIIVFKPLSISILIFLALVNALFLLTRKKYEALKIRYKDEKNKKIRGWGVILYIILSMTLGIIIILTF